MSRTAVRHGYIVKAGGFDYVVLNVNPIKDSVTLRPTHHRGVPLSGSRSPPVETRLSFLLNRGADIRVSPPLCPKEAVP
mgnify:CR=1 FL=1